MRFSFPFLLTMFVYAVIGSTWALAHAQCDGELGLDKMEPVAIVSGARGEGRMQVFPQNNVERKVVALGKRAVPMLIACLTDERRTKQPVFDFWQETTAGDIAFSFLVDLFTDSKGRSTMEGILTYQNVRDESPSNLPEDQAWRAFVAKHGRKYIQRAWQDRWSENGGRIYWDKAEHCFIVKRP
jgi:hypothetical protein